MRQGPDRMIVLVTSWCISRVEDRHQLQLPMRSKWAINGAEPTLGRAMNARHHCYAKLQRLYHFFHVHHISNVWR